MDACDQDGIKPVRVITSKSGSSTDGCGACGKEFYEKDNYCSRCGRKIDWSDNICNS